MVGTLIFGFIIGAVVTFLWQRSVNIKQQTPIVQNVGKALTNEDGSKKSINELRNEDSSIIGKLQTLQPEAIIYADERDSFVGFAIFQNAAMVR